MPGSIPWARDDEESVRTVLARLASNQDQLIHLRPSTRRCEICATLFEIDDELPPAADTILPAMVDIARLGEQEWDVYRDVRLASLAEAPFAFGSRLAAERDRTEAEWRERLEHRTQFVAREGGRPVATVGYLAEAEGAVELVSMWVAPPVRGTGVAGLLVDAVVAEARDRGYETIVVWVSQGNEPAERLYVRHGFVRTGRVQPVDVDHPARGVEFEMRRVDSPR